MTDKVVHRLERIPVKDGGTIMHYTASAGHGQDWGIDNLSTAHDHGLVVPPIVYQTPDVTVYDIGHANDDLITSGDTNV